MKNKHKEAGIGTFFKKDITLAASYLSDGFMGTYHLSYTEETFCWDLWIKMKQYDKTGKYFCYLIIMLK